MSGILYGIGVGPGDPDLMTVKAIKASLSCDIIAVPHKQLEKCFALKIAIGAVPELEDKPLLAVDMPMTKDPEVLEKAYAAGAALLEAQLDAGKNVAFLTIGDPTVYSTYMYLHERIVADGYAAKIIPGVTSFCAAAAALGTALCKSSEELHIIPGTYRPTEALDYPGVKVLMKNNLPETTAALKARSQAASMVENCSLPTQKIYKSVEEFPAQAGYFTLLIVKDE